MDLLAGSVFTDTASDDRETATAQIISSSPSSSSSRRENVTKSKPAEIQEGDGGDGGDSGDEDGGGTHHRPKDSEKRIGLRLEASDEPKDKTPVRGLRGKTREDSSDETALDSSVPSCEPDLALRLECLRITGDFDERSAED